MGLQKETHKVDFGSNLTRQRERKGLKQYEVAEAIGVSPANYSNIERGKQQPTAAQIFKLVTKLEFDLYEIFGIEKSIKSKDDKTEFGYLIKRIKSLEISNQTINAQLENVVEEIVRIKKYLNQ